MVLRVRSAGAGLLALGLILGIAGLDGGTAAAASSKATNPVATTSGGVSNPTFYYGGATRLRVGEDLSALGQPSIVVTTNKGGSGDADAVAAIHSTGAKAYRYVQFFWAPDDSDYDGINLVEHPDWAFCRSGSQPVVGRTTGGGTQLALHRRQREGRPGAVPADPWPDSRPTAGTA